MRLSLLVLFLFFIGLDFYGQKAVVFGVIKDSQGATLPSVNIQASTGKGGAANGAGEYSIEIPADSLVTLKFTFIGQKPREFSFNLKPGERFEQNIVMQSDNTLDVIDIFGSGGSGNLQSIDPKIATGIPSIRGTVEDLLLQAPVNFTSELSSSYSVRGGSFDENLVYVNGIQVYRPFLVRAGQQEGLSFPNTQMIERISFSAGGFEAKYGDKMSSVLDITYRKPKEFGGAFSASLLGASLQLERNK